MVEGITPSTTQETPLGNEGLAGSWTELTDENKAYSLWQVDLIVWSYLFAYNVHEIVKGFIYVL